MEKIDKEWSTVCSHRDVDGFIFNVPSDLDKYVVDKQL